MGRSYPAQMGRSYLDQTDQTKPISEVKNCHGPHTVAKSEFSGQIYSNSSTLCNCPTNDCCIFTDLPRSICFSIYVSFLSESRRTQPRRGCVDRGKSS